MKFNKSNIQVFGNITINIHHPQNGFKLCWNEEKVISLERLNKSQSGVYCIRNKFNGKIYIGMARNLENRYKRHISDLAKNLHKSKSMQLDFDSMVIGDIIGKDKANFEDVFEFEVIIYCRPSELTFYENILINNLHPEYNTKKVKEK